MKKQSAWLAWILAAALLASGCGAPAQDGAADVPAPAQDADIPAPVGETPAAEPLMEETVLADNSSIKVTVTEFDPAGDLGPTFTLLLENRTDSSLYFTINDVSVNDVMNDPHWGQTVPAGESLTSRLYWFYQDLATTGINYVSQVEGTLWVYDAEDFSAEDTYEDAVSWTVNNGPMDVPPAEEAVFSGGIEDMELFSTEAVTAVIKDYASQGDWGPSLTIYLENSADSPVLFFMSSVSVNGAALPTYWSEDVAAGKTAYSPCYFWQDDIDENEIEDIEIMVFTFTAVEYDTWETLAKVTVTISLEGSGEIMEKIVSMPQ